MENKCCCEHDKSGVNVCVHVNGCCGSNEKTCTCVPTLGIAIGEGGQFATLTEALEYAGTVVHDSLVIELLSDVTETRTEQICFNGFGDNKLTAEGVQSLVLKGNGHKLNLNSITGNWGLIFTLGGKGWLHDVTIIAQNTKVGIVGAGPNSLVFCSGNINLKGSESLLGFHAYWGGNITFEYSDCNLENLSYGVKANISSAISIISSNVTFNNVTTNYSPAPNTLGNNNAYIYVE